MARWKLACSHYLRLAKPVEWEYNETDLNTGEQVRKRYEVPKLLDINDPRCWTNSWGNQDNRQGEVVVCILGKGEGRDIAFIGDPTPDMIPLDEEAQEISDAFKEHWAYKPDVPETGNFSQSLIDRTNIEPAPIEVKGLDLLLEQMAAQQAQNSELLRLLTAAQPRRV